MRPLLIDGMHGLGDNLYQRAVLRQFRPGRAVFLITSWPQIYADLPHIRCVRHPNMQLRTQARNASLPGLRWYPAPVGADRVRWHYVGRPEVPIIDSLFEELGMLPPDRVELDGPPVQRPPQAPEVPYVVIRPATIRAEWRADSRNPRPEYLAEAAAAAQAAGFAVVSVADLAAGKEWPVEPLPPASARYHAGELSVTDLFGLIAGAAGVITGVGWGIVAALAYRVPALLVYGGWGVHNGPARIFGSRIDTSRVVQAVPDQFCMCGSNSHDCDKSIAGIGGFVDEFIGRIV